MWHALSPWLAFAALVVLFEIPALLLGSPWRPSGEPLLLATAWLLGERVRGGVWLRRAVVALGVLLVVHRLDRAGFLAFMGEEPLFYDQLFLLRHLLVLISDIWNARVALALVGAVCAVAVAIWLLRRLLGALALPAGRTPLVAMQAAGALLWALALIGTFVGTPPAVQWQSPILWSDLARSARIYVSVQRRIGASPYAGYGALALSRKPDVHLVLVESYGRVMVEHPAMYLRWTAHLKHMQSVIDAGGWHVVSGFSRAPIMGGRSWLAESTVLTGMRVSYQAVYHHLMSQIDRVPHVVSFLKGQGYTSLLLGPADRTRPGVRQANPYRYDHQLGFDELRYQGPRAGWGLVPDQYSLGFAHEHVIGKVKAPLFFNFHMVTSHAPWKEVPLLVADWRTLNHQPGPPIEATRGSPYADLKRFVRSTRSFARMGELRTHLVHRYAAAILYELAVVEQHLAAVKRDALVVVLGDHQPPFLAAETLSFDTPVHVFARDPKLLDELREHGFRDGLRIAPGQATTTVHEGLFSLLVRSLARCCSAGGGELPPYRYGIALGGD
jgi:hypothetical protein